MRWIASTLWAAGIFFAGGIVHAQLQADEPLTKLVIVMREGTSVPVTPVAEARAWSAEPWPAWAEAPGALTAHGARGVAELGKYYRRFSAEAALLTAAGCPTSGAIFVHADRLPRAQATGQAFIDGFGPGCALAVRASAEPNPAPRGASAAAPPEARPDPLFHPLEAGVCRLDPRVAQEEVMARAQGDLNRIARDLAGPFAALQKALECCQPTLCRAFGRAPTCGLADLPSALSPLREGAGLKVLGALHVGASASTALVDRYLAGTPLPDVGWGRVSAASLRDASRIAVEQRDLLQRTPYLARKRGSALLHRVAAAVTSARLLGFGVIDPAVSNAAVVVYVGGEDNLANLASLLDVSWLQAGFQRNQAPPGGALVFEVREHVKDRKLRVYTSFVAQNAEQLRNATALIDEAPPARTPLRLPGCSSTASGLPCTIDEFAIAVRNVIDRDCVD